MQGSPPTSSILLFGKHLRILLFAFLLTLPVSLIIGITAVNGFTSPRWNLSGFILLAVSAGALADAILLFVLYAPLRNVDLLESDQLYVQNPVFSRAVVFVNNLPLMGVLRSVAWRGVIAGVTMYLLDPSIGVSWIALSVCLVPVLPGIFEMTRLRNAVRAVYPDFVASRGMLLEQWKRRVWNVGLGSRVAVFVLMLGAAPLCVVAVFPEVQAIVLAFTVAAVTAATGFLLEKDARSSRDVLLEAMRHLERNKPGREVHLASADEFATLADGMSGMIAGMKEQSFIRDTFGKYVPRAIVEAVIRNGVKLKGEHKVVALMMVGIRDFDGRVRESPPQDVVRVLNEYLAAVITAAQHFTGTIDKVNGDRVLVVFGAPVALDAPVDRAMLAALELRKTIEKLNRKLSLRQPVHMQATIHHGLVVAGHIGASERWEYSVVGEGVRVVTDIHEHAYTAGADILLSGIARNHAGAGFVLDAVTADPTRNDIEVHALREHRVTRTEESAGNPAPAIDIQMSKRPE